MKQFNIWGYLLVALLFAIGIYYLVVKVKSCNSPKVVNVQIGSEDSLKRELRVWVDKYNREHTTLKESQSDNIVLQYKLESAANELGIKVKQIEKLTNLNAALKLKAKLNIDSQGTIVVVDSTSKDTLEKPFVFFSFEDKPWVSVHGDVGFSDTLYVEAYDSLQAVSYWDRNWFLGPKVYYYDLSHSNTKYINIPNISNVSRRIPDPTFLIAPSISTGWNVTNWNWNSPSVRVGFSVIYYPLSIRIRKK